MKSLSFLLSTKRPSTGYINAEFLKTIEKSILFFLKISHYPFENCHDPSVEKHWSILATKKYNITKNEALFRGAMMTFSFVLGRVR
jgi:hypothetical protein